MTYWLTVLFTIAASGAALAQEVVVSEMSTETRRLEDPSIDRGVLTSHAETVGESQVVIDTHGLLVYGASYGVTDRLQLSANLSLMGPLSGIAASGKYVLHRDEETVVSVQGFALMAALSGFGAGVLVDRYLGDLVGVHAQIGIAGMKPLGGSEETNSTPPLGFVYANAGVTLRVSDSVKFLGELWFPAPLAMSIETNPSFKGEPLALFTYGMRLSGETLAWDIAMIRPFHEGYEDVVRDRGPKGGARFLLFAGLPYTGLSARF